MYECVCKIIHYTCIIYWAVAVTIDACKLRLCCLMNILTHYCERLMYLANELFKQANPSFIKIMLTYAISSMAYSKSKILILKKSTLAIDCVVQYHYNCIAATKFCVTHYFVARFFAFGDIVIVVSMF